MNKRVFLFSVITIVAISIPIFIVLQTRPTAGTVLGSSVNNFYIKKAIATSQPPRGKKTLKIR